MRALRVLLAIVGGLAVLLGGFLIYVDITGVPSYPVPKVELRVAPSPERVARGRLLAGMLCAECHRDPTTQALTGRELKDMPKQFGSAYSKNITRDPQDGIGGWSDVELATLIRTGVHRSGQYIPPWMVKLPRISDDDLASILAFLHSDDPLVAPMKGRQPAGKITLFAKLLTHTVMKPLPPPAGPIATPSEADPVEFGRYLALDVLECFACHSADFATNNELVPEKSKGFFAGGNGMPDINQRLILTANLTPDKETGIGSWSQADFRRALQKGFRPDHRVLRNPMPRYVELSDAWSDALFAYLRTVPALKNPVARDDDPHLDPSASLGEHAYGKYSCASCHGLSGEGICDLRGADQKYKTDAEMIAWIRDASKLKPETQMPTWDGVIAESDYQPLSDYVRLLGKRWQESATVAASH